MPDRQARVDESGSGSDTYGVSIILCSFNRAGPLRAALDSLAAIRPLPADGLEIIVVDNNSTDSTRQVVEAFMATSAVPVRYVLEPRQGLSHARNAGLAAAGGAVVAFTDDDVRVDPGWIAALLDGFSALPSAGMICGQTLPASADTAPIGMRTSTAQQTYCRATEALAAGTGNNMAVRRNVVRKVGGFDPLLGAGARCAAAEDTDFFFRVLGAGHCIGYWPQAVVYHDHGRASGSAIRRIQANYLVGRGAMLAKHSLRLKIDAWRMLYWEHRGLVGELFGDAQRRQRSMFCLSGLWRGMLVRLAQEAGFLRG